MTDWYVETNEEFGTKTVCPDRATAERFYSSEKRYNIGKWRWYHDDMRLQWFPSTNEFFIVDEYDNCNAYIEPADDAEVVHWFMMKHAQDTKDDAFFEDFQNSKKAVREARVAAAEAIAGVEAEFTGSGG